MRVGHLYYIYIYIYILKIYNIITLTLTLGALTLEKISLVESKK